MNSTVALLLGIATILVAGAIGAEPGHRVVADWPVLPKGKVLGLCAGIGVDAQNRVFIFHRCGRQWTKPFATEPIAEPTVSVFDGATGRLLSEWGANTFVMPHGLSVDQKGGIWLTDVALQQVFHYTAEGKLLRAWGERGKEGNDHSHFNLPTDVAPLADGSFYVSDGYRNTRVMKFSAAGDYEFEWGRKGKEPGEFNLPHGIAVDSHGKVYVCDRSNARLQVFKGDGSFLTAWQGANIGRPYGVAMGPDDHVFIVDGGEQSVRSADHEKVVELSADGTVIDTFGSHGKGPGQFQTGHDIAVGPDGAVYVAEGGGKRVQKFVQTKN